jgi:hypothetical protein
MRRSFKCVGAGLAGIAGAFAIQSHAATTARPTIEQSKILDLLERGAHHALKLGDHVPVTALVMRPDGQVQLIDLEQSFAHPDDALTATFMRLIPLAKAKQIKASGIMLQPGDAGEEKLPVLLFDLEQVGHPRFLVMLTYQRDGDVVKFGPKTYKVAPAKLLAD